jgi:hypothetical protein
MRQPLVLGTAVADPACRAGGDRFAALVTHIGREPHTLADDSRTAASDDRASRTSAATRYCRLLLPVQQRGDMLRTGRVLPRRRPRRVRRGRGRRGHHL